MAAQETLDALVANRVQDGLSPQEKADLQRQQKKHKDVNLNLAFARAAVNAVLRKVPRAANWDERRPNSAEFIESAGLAAAARRLLSYDMVGWSIESRQAVETSERLWNATDRCVYGNLRSDPEWGEIYGNGGVHNFADIQIYSDLAETHGCGNCAEMAASTFGMYKGAIPSAHESFGAAYTAYPVTLLTQNLQAMHSHVTEIQIAHTET